MIEKRALGFPHLAVDAITPFSDLALQYCALGVKSRIRSSIIIREDDQNALYKSENLVLVRNLPTSTLLRTC